MKVEGSSKYVVEPTITKGRLPYHSTSVAVKAYVDSSKMLQVPLKIKWFRYIAERHYEIQEIEDSEVYDFSAADIGIEVKAIILPKDNSDKTKVSVSFGPIKFDPLTRPPLESVLLSGFSKFNILVESQNKEKTINDGGEPCSVFVSSNQIKLFYLIYTPISGFSFLQGFYLFARPGPCLVGR